MNIFILKEFQTYKKVAKIVESAYTLHPASPGLNYHWSKTMNSMPDFSQISLVFPLMSFFCSKIPPQTPYCI